MFPNVGRSQSLGSSRKVKNRFFAIFSRAQPSTQDGELLENFELLLKVTFALRRVASLKESIRDVNVGLNDAVIGNECFEERVVEEDVLLQSPDHQKTTAPHRQAAFVNIDAVFNWSSVQAEVERHEERRTTDTSSTVNHHRTLVGCRAFDLQAKLQKWYRVVGHAVVGPRRELVLRYLSRRFS